MKRTPYPYQRQGIEFLKERDQALLADEMGLGKSAQAIIAAAKVCSPTGSILIICPASLTYNWKSEIRAWTGEPASVLEKDEIPKSWPRWNIISIDRGKTKGAQRTALERNRWDVVVLDEAHYCKKASSGRHQFVAKLKTGRLWQLTGTPMPNRSPDLFGLLRLASNPLARSHGYFLQNFVGTESRPAPEHQVEKLRSEIQGWALRRTKAEVLTDLPPKVRVEMRAADLRPRHRKTALNDAGSVMAQRHALARAKISSTMTHIDEILLATESKVILFSNYTAVLDHACHHCQTVELGYVRVDGSVTGKNRKVAVERFQSDPKVRVFIGQIVAAGVGLTLTAASYVVFNDLALMPAEHLQAEDRAHRIGAKDTVHAYYMLSDADLDVVLWDALKMKQREVRSIEQEMEAASDSGGVSPQQLLELLERYHRENIK